MSTLHEKLDFIEFMYFEGYDLKTLLKVVKVMRLWEYLADTIANKEIFTVTANVNYIFNTEHIKIKSTR